MKFIFLDTSVFFAKNFNYNSNVFTTLKLFAHRGYVERLTTSIIEEEINSNISKKIAEGVKHLNKNNIIKNIDLYTELFKATRSDFETILINQYKTFSEELKTNNVPIDTVDINDLFYMYFNRKAPFSEKKKSEFPDATNLLALVDWSKKKNEEVIVVGGDGDLENFCKNESRLVFYKSIEKLMNFLLNEYDDVLYNHIIKSFQKNWPENIKWNLEESLKSEGYFASEWTAEVVDIENLEIVSTIQNPDIIGVDKDKLEVVLSIDIDFIIKAEIEYVDEENSHYDSERKGYALIEFTNRIIEKIISVPVQITMKYSPHSTDDFEFIEAEVDEEGDIDLSSFPNKV